MKFLQVFVFLFIYFFDIEIERAQFPSQGVIKIPQKSVLLQSLFAKSAVC